MFNKTKFTVDLSIERVTRIPYSSGSIFVRWNVLDSPRPDAHDRSKSRTISNTEAKLGYSTQFKQRIGLRTPSRILRSTTIKFEVVWEPIGGRGVTIGTLNLDLSQFAHPHEAAKKESSKSSFNWGLDSGGRKSKEDSDEYSDAKSALANEGGQKQSGEGGREHDSLHGHSHESSHGHGHGRNHDHDVYGRPLLYLLSGARNNCLLEVAIKLDYISGETDYRPVEFDGPAVNYNQDGDDTDINNLAANLKGSQTNREKLRKLKRSVLDDLMNEDKDKDSRCSLPQGDWLDLDSFLMGNRVRMQSKALDEELAKNGIREVETDSETLMGNHEEGTPYLETDIRPNFINWNVMGSI